MSKFGGKWARPKGFRTKIFIPDGCDYDPTKPDHFEAFSADLKFPHGFRQGEPIEWAWWQLDRIIRPIFGLRWSDTGYRTIMKALIVMGRGGGKTAKAAVMGTYGLLDNENGVPEVDLFSLSRETADRMWQFIAALIRAQPMLDGVIDLAARSRKAYAGSGQLVVRSGDADAEMGHNPTMALVDELASLRNRDLYDAVSHAFGKRPEGLMMMMTTPSLDAGRFAKEEYDHAKSILADRSKDPTYLPVIYEADENDDPFKPATWHKANPGIRSGYINERVIAQQAEEARLDRTRLHAFKVQRLCIWADAGGGFLDMTAWDDCAGDMKADEFLHLPCWFGLDMAATTDLASLCSLWWDSEEEVAYAAWWHWSTQAMSVFLNQHTHGRWNGYLESDKADVHLFHGDWIDDDAVAEQVVELAGLYYPQAIGIDSFRSRKMMKLLGDQAGLPVDLLSSTGRQMQAATEQAQALVGKRRLNHNGDPVARWCAQNTEVTLDGFGFPKIVKRDLDRHVRIDAMAALCMAVDRKLAWERDGGEAQVFVYDPEEPGPEDPAPIYIGDRQ